MVFVNSGGWALVQDKLYPQRPEDGDVSKCLAKMFRSQSVAETSSPGRQSSPQISPGNLTALGVSPRFRWSDGCPGLHNETRAVQRLSRRSKATQRTSKNPAILAQVLYRDRPYASSYKIYCLYMSHVWGFINFTSPILGFRPLPKAPLFLFVAPSPNKVDTPKIFKGFLWQE